MTSSTTVIQVSPLGWWLNYKEDQWTGPFKTPEEAEAEAKILVPPTYTKYTLLQVAPWEKREVKNPAYFNTYEPCPDCGGTGFRGNGCCRTCEGTMRVPGKRRAP